MEASDVTHPDMIPTWSRKIFSSGGGNARLFYKVYGQFTALPEISRTRHRCAGVPDGCELYLQSRQAHSESFMFGLDGYFGDLLREHGSELVAAVMSAPQCFVVYAETEDPSTLDYFRDLVGIVTALLDGGGLAVFDPYMVKWWSAADWRGKVFAAGGAEPSRHVVILRSEEANSGGTWFHTRGMLKFGRPDLSVHGVPPGLETSVKELCDRFIELMAAGAVIPTGQRVRMTSLPEGWRCLLRGHPDDPDFNNRHLEVGLPGFEDLTIGVEGLAVSSLLSGWNWLLSGDERAIGMSYFGDWFLERQDGGIVMLDTVTGELRELAANRGLFEEALRLGANLDEWFMADLLFDCLNGGKVPGPGQCLSFVVPPVLGGELEGSNIELADIAVHQSITAQIHEQTKDLPDGTTIPGFVISE